MKYGLIANTHKPIFWEKLPEFLTWFANQNIPLVLAEAIPAEAPEPLPLLEQFPILPPAELVQQCDMILAIGGDGTILRTVHTVLDLERPILGINVGGLGFMTEIPMESFFREFTKILKGEYQVEKRLVLKGEITGIAAPVYALNEILVDKGGSVRVIQIEVNIDGQFLNSYVADGLIISTPTGSTGYSLSSGGPIIVPSTEVLIINPICPHSLTNRPVVIPADSHIEITTRTEAPEFIASADGQNAIPCPTRTQIRIERAPFCAHLVKPRESTFFQLLHHKLGWGSDFRDKQRWSHNS